MIRKMISLAVMFGLVFQQVGLAQMIGEVNIAGRLSRMNPDSIATDAFRPLHLRYLSYDNRNSGFKLLLDKGSLNENELKTEKLESQTQELLKYFFIGLSLPNDSFWVNLRPDAEDNIIDNRLAMTDIGKIMLETDLQLKKDTAGFTSPQTTEGREYWDKLYKKAGELFGSENITIPTLTRPWIVPGEIIIRETADSAYIYKASLKVMLEQDYLKGSLNYSFKDERSKALNEYSSQLIRELIIPKLTQEVNSSKRYAGLRQVYYSLIMAQWFKARHKGEVSQKSAIPNLIDSQDLTNLVSQETWSKTTYFQAYQKSFKDGEYNIQEQVSTPAGQVIKSYFSGGQMLDASIPSLGSSPAVIKGVGPISVLPANSAPVISGEKVVGATFAKEPKISREGITRRNFLELGIGSFVLTLIGKPGDALADILQPSDLPDWFSHYQYHFIDNGGLAYDFITQGDLVTIQFTMPSQSIRGQPIPFPEVKLYFYHRKDNTIEFTLSDKTYIVGPDYPNYTLAISEIVGVIKDALSVDKRSQEQPFLNALLELFADRLIPDFKTSATDENNVQFVVETVQGAVRLTIISRTGTNYYVFSNSRNIFVKKQGSDGYFLNPIYDTQLWREALGDLIQTINEALNNMQLSSGKSKLEGAVEYLKTIFFSSYYFNYSINGVGYSIQGDYPYITFNGPIPGLPKSPYAPYYIFDSITGDLTFSNNDGKAVTMRSVEPGYDRYIQVLIQHMVDVITKYPEVLQAPFDGAFLDMVINQFKRDLLFQGRAGALIKNGNVSSPALDKPVGGIDFRALPIVSSAVNNLSLNASSSLSLSRLKSFNSDQEWQDIQKTIEAKMIPSGQRILENIQVSCVNGNLDTRKAVSSITGILRLEEERNSPTEATLRDILVVLESGKSAQELKEVFIGAKR